MLTDLFNHLGMTTKEQDIYHVVLAHHKTSASIVAQTLTRERTSTYKMMKNMVSQGFLSTTHEHGTTFFLPTAWTQLWHRFESQSRQTQSLLESHKSLKQEYESLQSSHQFATQVTLRSGTAGIDYAYDTMNQIIADQ
jgi:sugar-specific transcriptional regulator TrmB